MVLTEKELETIKFDDLARKIKEEEGYLVSYDELTKLISDEMEERSFCVMEKAAKALNSSFPPPRWFYLDCNEYVPITTKLELAYRFTTVKEAS